MTDAAFQACFYTTKQVPSRGIVQFVFEVPVEKATGALEMLGGYPKHGEVWVGIARLNQPVSARSPDRERIAPADAATVSPAIPHSGGGAQPRGADGDAKPRKRWEDMPVAQRAALICSDPRSWPVIAQMAQIEFPNTALIAVDDDNSAVKMLRALCRVETRAEITKYPLSFAMFQRIETEYMRATGRIASP